MDIELPKIGETRTVKNRNRTTLDNFLLYSISDARSFFKKIHEFALRKSVKIGKI
jgi:hypothetical protein